LGGFGAGAGGFLEGDVADVEGALDVLVAFEEVFDGEELDAGVFVAGGAGGAGRGVEAGFGGLALHGPGGLFEGDVDADFGFLTLEDADEVAEFGDADVLAALDGEDDLPGVAGFVVVEVEAAVDAAVGPFLDGFGGARSAEAERPVLELVLVRLGAGIACGGIGDDVSRG
jgi:hypothetical protein